MSCVTLVVTVLLATPGVFVPAGPVSYPSAMAEAVIQSIYRGRERTEEWFHTNPESFLAAIQRRDFAERTSLTIGTAEDCDLQIDDGLFRPHHLRVTVAGDSFHVEALDDSALFRVAEFETRDTTIAPNSIAIGKQGVLWGRYHLRLSHQHHPAIILFDAWSPRFHEYRGLKHFPADLNYRFALPLEPNPSPDTISIASTRGPGRPAARLGWFNFMVGKTHCRVVVLRMIEPGLPPDNMVVFFRDATSGKETAALGRYAEVHRLGNTGNYLLDFNSATSPSCAFSDLYNCPIPPKENTLKVAILAGEKDLGYLKARK